MFILHLIAVRSVTNCISDSVFVHTWNEYLSTLFISDSSWDATLFYVIHNEAIFATKWLSVQFFYKSVFTSNRIVLWNGTKTYTIWCEHGLKQTRSSIEVDAIVANKHISFSILLKSTKIKVKEKKINVVIIIFIEYTWISLIVPIWKGFWICLGF